jgi:hypothetical protein
LAAFIYREIPFGNDRKTKLDYKAKEEKTKPFYKIPHFIQQIILRDCRFRVIRMDCVTIAFFDHNDQKD